MLPPTRPTSIDLGFCIALVVLTGCASARTTRPAAGPPGARKAAPAAPPSAPTCPDDAACTEGHFPAPGLAIFTADERRIVDLATGELVASHAISKGAAAAMGVDDEETTVEKFEAVDFDGDGIDELVEIELSRSEATASRSAAIYRIAGRDLVDAGSWSLMDSNGTEGWGCKHDFRYSDPDSAGRRTVSIGGGEYAGEGDPASAGCDPDDADYILASGTFQPAP